MEIVSLDVQTRNAEETAKDLRRADFIPLEYYGHGVDNKSMKVDYQTFRKAFRISGSNTVVELNVDGKEKINVLVHDVQYEPVTDAIIHVDFVNVRMDEEISTKIPLVFVGLAPAVKELSGVLMTNIKEVDVKCLPKNLVHTIEVNIESLVDFHSAIHVSDVTAPEGITILNDSADMVITAVAPREEEVDKVVETGEGEEGEEGEEGGEAKEGEEGEKKEGEEGSGEEKK